MRFQNRRHRDRLVLVIVARVHIGAYLAVNDHLRTGVARWLQQHRIHVGMRRQPRCLRLQCLRAADLAAVGGHCAIQCHILRLERRHLDAFARQQAAEGGNEGAFAGIGGCALHHQCGEWKFHVPFPVLHSAVGFVISLSIRRFLLYRGENGPVTSVSARTRNAPPESQDWSCPQCRLVQHHTNQKS